MNDPEVNKLELDNIPPHVEKAVREEHLRFRKELHTFGPQVVGMENLKPRLRAAAEKAIRQHEQENQ